MVNHEQRLTKKGGQTIAHLWSLALRPVHTLSWLLLLCLIERQFSNGNRNESRCGVQDRTGVCAHTHTHTRWANHDVCLSYERGGEGGGGERRCDASTSFEYQHMATVIMFTVHAASSGRMLSRACGGEEQKCFMQQFFFFFANLFLTNLSKHICWHMANLEEGAGGELGVFHIAAHTFSSAVIESFACHLFPILLPCRVLLPWRWSLGFP